MTLDGGSGSLRISAEPTDQLNAAMMTAVGLTEIDDGEWDLYFGPLRLGRLHERTLQVEDALGRSYRRPY